MLSVNKTKEEETYLHLQIYQIMTADEYIAELTKVAYQMRKVLI